MRLEYECDPFNGTKMYSIQYSCECGARSPDASVPGTDEAVYLAATRRPPNLPLAKEQIMEMDNDDALWLVDTGKDTQPNEDEMSEESEAGVMSVREFTRVFLDIWNDDTKAFGGEDTGCIEFVVFAAKPTHADIEATRKEE